METDGAAAEGEELSERVTAQMRAARRRLPQKDGEAPKRGLRQRAKVRVRARARVRVRASNPCLTLTRTLS